MRMTRLAYLVSESTSPQYVLAGRAHIAPTTFSRYVCGTTPIQEVHLEAVCNVMGSTDVCGWVDLVPA